MILRRSSLYLTRPLFDKNLESSFSLPVEIASWFESSSMVCNELFLMVVKNVLMIKFYR